MRTTLKRLLTYATVFSSAVFIQCSQPEKNTENAENSIQDQITLNAIGYDFTPTDTTWKSLSLREKIGQTMIVRSHYYTEHTQNGTISLDRFLVKYPIGGLFMADWHFSGSGPKNIPAIQKLHKAIEEYHKASKYPIIISEDFERGLSKYEGYTHMPAEMSIGAANSKEFAYNFGKTLALESKDLGLNWLLHPVADLNMNPLHSLVIERAISDDADRALPLLQQQIKGMHDNGVVSTIKHFPGDGATIRDQHLITSANNLSLGEWSNTFGKVFQGLINEGAPSIMVGHIRFPAYQKETLKGLKPPASLSKEIMVDLLKDKMKFGGVVMSDALNMGGAAGYYANELETAIKSFEAGADIILWPGLAYMDSVEARILRGEIPMSRLDDAVQRVWGVREKFGLLKKKESPFTPLTEPAKEEIAESTQKLADKAITLIKDANKDLPLTPKKDSSILLVNISYTDKSADFELTKTLLEEKGFKVTLRYLLSFYEFGWQIDTYFKQFDKIIVCFENKYFDPLGVSLFKNHEALSLWCVNMLPREKVIGISYSNPYYNNFYLETAPLLINAYSSDPFSQRAVVKTLTGEIPFEGTSPVKLDHDIMK